MGGRVPDVAGESTDAPAVAVYNRPLDRRATEVTMNRQTRRDRASTGPPARGDQPAPCAAGLSAAHRCARGRGCMAPIFARAAGAEPPPCGSALAHRHADPEIPHRLPGRDRAGAEAAAAHARARSARAGARSFAAGRRRLFQIAAAVELPPAQRRAAQPGQRPPHDRRRVPRRRRRPADSRRQAGGAEGGVRASCSRWR